MTNQILENQMSISAGNDLPRGLNIELEETVIKGDDIGINAEIPKESLGGRFRLMNGNVYKIIDDTPPPSELLNLADQIQLDDHTINP